MQLSNTLLCKKASHDISWKISYIESSIII